MKLILFILLLNCIYYQYLRCVHGIASTLPVPVDLSHSLSQDTLNWRKDFKFRLIDRVNKTLENGIFYASNNFIAAEHGGTHLDAPSHFNVDGWKTDEIPLERLLGAGVVVDVSDRVTLDNFQLRVSHLEEWEKRHGPLPQDSIVLVNFGWARKYPNRKEYFGSETPPYNFPGISGEAAKWIVDSKKIVGVGVDTPSMDAGNSTDYPTHRILYAANIFGLENVAMSKANLPAKGFNLIVLPVKIENGSGGPVRIVAI